MMKLEMHILCIVFHNVKDSSCLPYYNYGKILGEKYASSIFCAKLAL